MRDITSEEMETYIQYPALKLNFIESWFCPVIPL